MTVENFLTQFNSRDFATFESHAALKLIKGSHEKTHNTFFSNYPKVTNVSMSWQNDAICIVAYAIKMSGNGMFSNLRGLAQMDNRDLTMCYNRRAWQDILQMFVNEISLDTDEAFWTEFYNETTTPQFIQQSCLQSNLTPLLVPLYFEMIRWYLPERFEGYIASWKAVVGESNFPLFSANPPFGNYSSFEHMRGGIAVDVENAMKLQTNFSSSSCYECRDRVVYPTLRNSPIVGEKRLVSTSDYDEGVAVLDWINDGYTRELVEITDIVNCTRKNIITYSEWEVDPDPTGCVTATTRISLPDGSTLPIIDIKSGCKILSEGGQISVTSDEFIINTDIHTLYGINDMEPFMSLEHAVMTLDGWKSLNPIASNAINAHFNVTELKVGDFVVTQDGVLKVERLTIANAPQDTAFTGYDMHFRQGYSSYYANGLLVLLNYPELTIARTKRNIKNMQKHDAEIFSALILEHQDLFTQVLGTAAINSFLQENDSKEREVTKQ